MDLATFRGLYLFINLEGAGFVLKTKTQHLHAAETLGGSTDNKQHTHTIRKISCNSQTDVRKTSIWTTPLVQQTDIFILRLIGSGQIMAGDRVSFLI